MWALRRRLSGTTRRRALGPKRCQSSDATSSSTESLTTKLSELSQNPKELSAWTSRLSQSQRQSLNEWLALKSASSSTTSAVAVPQPSQAALRLVMLNASLPFIGFGFLDNAILIVAGDAIDTSLGVALGISTLCAAAIGNIISDVAGVLLGTAIEDFCATHLKLPVPDLTTAQRRLRSVRFASQWGCGLGLVIGCILGMFPLLLLDSNKVQVKKREAHLNSLFRDVIAEAGGLVGASRTSLYVLVEADPSKDSSYNYPVPTADGNFLYNRYSDDNKLSQERLVPLGRGIVSRAALTGEVWNIRATHKEPDFMPTKDLDAQTMLCVPVMDNSGRTIGVIEAINKIVPDEKAPVKFYESDVQILKALASHISVSLQRLSVVEEGEEAETSLKHAIKLLKDYGLSAINASELDKDANAVPLFPEE